MPDAPPLFDPALALSLGKIGDGRHYVKGVLVHHGVEYAICELVPDWIVRCMNAAVERIRRDHPDG